MTDLYEFPTPFYTSPIALSVYNPPAMLDLEGAPSCVFGVHFRPF